MALSMTDNLFKRVATRDSVINNPAQGLTPVEMETYGIDGVGFAEAFTAWAPMIGLGIEVAGRDKLVAQFLLGGSSLSNLIELRDLLVGAPDRPLWLLVFASTFRRIEVEAGLIEEGADPDTDPRLFGYTEPSSAVAAINRVS